MQKYPTTAQETENLKKRLGRQAVPPPLRKRLEAEDAAQAKEEPEEKLKLEDLDMRQWEAWISEGSADEVLEYLKDELMPWLQISEKMGVHIHMQAAAITALHRKGKAMKSVKKLTERVAPVIALKEDVDDYLSTLCVRVLEGLENEHKVGVNGAKDAE